MNSSKMNMYFGTILATVFVLMTLSIVSESIFHDEAPKTDAFPIEVAESTSGSTTTAAKEEGLPEISSKLASADIEAGKSVFKKCASCHTATDGGANKVGPALWGVINKPLGSADGFGYSAALKEFSKDGSVVWDYETLNSFLAKPKKYIKGTAMGFAGLKKEKDRANIIAFLRSMAASPAALPGE